ncbi:MAG: ribonuclease H-like domain-containing protein [Fuerstiella sp.]
MITEALLHCRGVGPIRLGQLQAVGVRNWRDAVTAPERLPPGLRAGVVEEADRCLRALAENNIRYFVDSFFPQDRWRILSQYVDRATFFDIETTGLEYDDTITVIVCWHRDQLRSFVEHENLDDFLDVLDEAELLVSFNGSTFDVPRVLDGFHIPDLPCPHLDLRWPCWHRQLCGGLKDVSQKLGVHRPADLQDADGDLAVRLWWQWQHQQNQAARSQLIRYCAADVLLLRPVAEHLAGRNPVTADDLWQHLPESESPHVPVDPLEQRRRVLQQSFGSASPGVLRTLRTRRRG